MQNAVTCLIDLLSQTRLHNLDVDQVVIDHLHRPASDVIHPADPLHLVVCLELLRDTFRLSHLLYQPREHFLCLPVDVGKITI
jgi:hypothetical protein